MKDILKLLEFTADKAAALAATQSVTDEPMVFGDITVIPVSSLSCGFAGGGSDVPSKRKADAILAGAGASVKKTPLSFLAVCGSDVRILRVSAECDSKESVLSALTPLVEEWREKHKDGKRKGAAK